MTKRSATPLALAAAGVAAALRLALRIFANSAIGAGVVVQAIARGAHASRPR